MQPKRQSLNKTSCSLLLLVLIIAMIPTQVIATSHLSTEHQQTTSHPCDEQRASTRISTSYHLDLDTLLTDTCQGDGCLQCSTCAAVSLSISNTHQLPLGLKPHYLSQQGSETDWRLERPPKS